MNERLEEIKEAIAHELGLTDDFMDGTYLYYLTRSKTAFSVGTMSLDDFEEIDEGLLEEIINAIKPFFIQQIKINRELNEELFSTRMERDGYRYAVDKLRERVKELEETLNVINSVRYIPDEVNREVRQTLKGDTCEN